MPTDAAMQTLVALYIPGAVTYVNRGGWTIDALSRHVGVHPADMNKILSLLTEKKLVTAKLVDGYDETNIMSWRFYLTGSGLDAVAARNPTRKKPAS